MAKDLEVAILFADVVGSTQLYDEYGDAKASETVSLCLDVMKDATHQFSGTVIKTIGDEVMFVADDRETAARIALSLAGGHALDHLFPQVRVGVAYGDVLRRLGDVYGEVVNIASRLTTLARPGRVLTNGEMADALADNDEFRVRRARTAVVKGYSRLETWSLRRPKPAPEERAAEKELERAEREARRDERRESRR